MDGWPLNNQPYQFSTTEMAELIRRRRGRSIATLVVLVALSVLFFAITIAKFKR